MTETKTFTRSTSFLKQSSRVQLPNLVLAGAPKCGTSSLFNWLAAHPEVCGSAPKETFYFMDESHPLSRSEANYHTHGLTRYQFFEHHASAKFFVDATTHYIYQETALNFFAACDPQPYIIFVLRKPSDRIFSSFSYTQNNLARLDQSISFDTFTNLLLQNSIEQIKHLFRSEQSYFVLRHDLLYSQYYDFLIRWKKSLPPNRLKIVLFEEMKANPKAIVTEIAEELGIDPDFYDRFNFQQKNQTVSIRNSWLHRNLRRIAPSLPNTALKTMLKSFYFSTQKHHSTEQSKQSQALEKLDQYFQPHNQKLEQAFHLDLSCWQK
ncbi:sulfotransferase domain-containing protein [Pseudanabaenaceae cyanobacterium LEGE 13415]|nr:sulfotransferase domain-containing protein [Pseudanabaenaceae cyanobacterium LEGE 13415]